MRYSLTPQAANDLSDLYDFIAADNSAAADRFLNNLEKKFEALLQTPKMGRKREELASSLRSFPVDRYVIFYRLVKKEIQIIRVLHGSRDIAAVFEE